ncbi:MULTISPECIES: acetylglutamate kinase [unclassified Micromonospora]|uniref:acetylglutamate kinase n=1 Tax=unclassified Micromonospora TaxID=2617518 RepID=UPI001C237C53|nr:MULTISPECIES: acetylglutamate kinase [unclassified Micromonospora]MBU8858612.1 acetylglutamate kinase [Micromonospora sp. WMMB482]MDM4784256.1 acetylglutamate kinase [Micromonospora sp. b486]
MVRTIVVKCGGNAAVNAEEVCRDVADLHGRECRIVLVHGGSAEIERLAGRLGVPTRRNTTAAGISTRHTDEVMLEVVQLALAGSIKPRLVTELIRRGVSAVGLTGLDGGVIRARRRAGHRAVVDGRRFVVRDHSGRITGVDGNLLTGLLDLGQVPVLSPPVLSEDGFPLNADADRVAASVACALEAETLVLLTGAPGVLADPCDEASVLGTCRVPPTGTPAITGGGIGMKLIAARDALLGGVANVTIADGRAHRPVHRALTAPATRVLLDQARPAATGSTR